MIDDVVEYGTHSAPTAGTAIATTGTLPAGDYRVTVYAIMTGTVVAATDINNIQLQVGASAISTLSFIPNANTETTEPPMTVNVPHGGATISVTAVANASVSVVYSVMLVVTQLAQYP